MGNMKPMHYKLDENHNPVPCDNFLEWADWMDESDTTVAVTNVGEFLISTVFLGLDRSFFGEGGPILFETMVFDHEIHSVYCSRARTWDEAVIMHNATVTLYLHGGYETSQQALKYLVN